MKPHAWFCIVFLLLFMNVYILNSRYFGPCWTTTYALCHAPGPLPLPIGDGCLKWGGLGRPCSGGRAASFPPLCALHAIGEVWAMRAHPGGWSAGTSGRDVRTGSNAGGQSWPDCFWWDRTIQKMEAPVLSYRRILQPSIMTGGRTIIWLGAIIAPFSLSPHLRVSSYLFGYPCFVLCWYIFKLGDYCHNLRDNLATRSLHYHYHRLGVFSRPL